VRPGDLRRTPEGFAARVELIEDLGDSAIVIIEALGQRLKLRTDDAESYREGSELRLGFAPQAAHLFDRASGARL
jgi:ABC-type sugar transport system ATPase subunit